MGLYFGSLTADSRRFRACNALCIDLLRRFFRLSWRALTEPASLDSGSLASWPWFSDSQGAVTPTTWLAYILLPSWFLVRVGSLSTFLTFDMWILSLTLFCFFLYMMNPPAARPAIR